MTPTPEQLATTLHGQLPPGANPTCMLDHLTSELGLAPGLAVVVMRLCGEQLAQSKSRSAAVAPDSGARIETGTRRLMVLILEPVGG